MSKDVVNGKKFWDKSAKYFGRSASTKFIVYPALKKLCGPLKGKNILDVACATGELSIFLAKKGANVVGIDSSQKMIEIAHQRARKQSLTNIEFLVKDAKKLEIFSKKKFDLIIINILFPHLKIKSDIEKVLKGLTDRLLNGGTILLAEPHPCFDFLMRKEILGGREKTRSYFQSGKPYEFTIEIVDGKKELRSVAYHWLIEDYASAIKSSGLIIKNIHEPRPVKSAALKLPEWYKERAGFPSYIIFEIVKC